MSQKQNTTFNIFCKKIWNAILNYFLENYDPKTFDRNNIHLNWKHTSWFILFLVMMFKLDLMIWQFNYYKLLVPPSPDLVNHLEMINDIKENGLSFHTTYPPLFHMIIALLSIIFNADPLQVLRFLGPYWLVIVIPPFYLLANKMFGYRIAFFSTLIFALVSTNPLLNFGDAQYPDILSYNLIAPFFLIFVINSVKKPTFKNLSITTLLLFLMTAAHHLTSTLIVGLCFLTCIIYAIANKKMRESEEYKSSIKVVIFFSVLVVLFFFVAQIFFGNLLLASLKSITSFNTLIKDQTSSVLSYQNLSSLLSPLIQFIGFSGLTFCLINLYDREQKETRFANLLLIIWIASFWLFSRSSIFVLPQRIFREVSLPLCISGGVFAVALIDMVKHRWHKIAFTAIFGYLIIINTSQVFAQPYLLPDGFRYQSWFNKEDQEKVNFIKANVPKGTIILTNNSNPFVSYFLKSASYRIVGFQSDTPQITNQNARDIFTYRLAKIYGATYLYVGVMPPNISPETYFIQFENYPIATEFLKNYDYSSDTLIKEFTDGSKLIKLN